MLVLAYTLNHALSNVAQALILNVVAYKSSVNVVVPLVTAVTQSLPSHRYTILSRSFCIIISVPSYITSIISPAAISQSFKSSHKFVFMLLAHLAFTFNVQAHVFIVLALNLIICHVV